MNGSSTIRRATYTNGTSTTSTATWDGVSDDTSWVGTTQFDDLARQALAEAEAFELWQVSHNWPSAPKILRPHYDAVRLVFLYNRFLSATPWTGKNYHKRVGR